MPTRDYQASLNEALADPLEAAAYLSACLDEGTNEFLLGLVDVARARGELGAVAAMIGVSTHEVDTLSINELNQRFTTVNDLAKALGVRLSCVSVR